MKSLVIGFGSIGRRHEEVLRSMGADTAVVSRHADTAPCRIYATVEHAVKDFQPEYIIIANRTSEHRATLDALEEIKFKGICLVEKPLSDKPLQDGAKYGFGVFVGYVMRFHPLIQEARIRLEKKELLSIDVYAGQYLPDWRPGTDYRECYSARMDQGGGVLRDLSHELDYLTLFAGTWKRVVALGGHVSGLNIETDDVYSLLMEMERCPVALCHINYLDRMGKRTCTIQYEGGTLHLDFMSNELTHNGDSQQVVIERNEMFRKMHAAAWNAESGPLCTLEEAAQLLELIHATEMSEKGKSWICRTSR